LHHPVVLAMISSIILRVSCLWILRSEGVLINSWCVPTIGREIEI